MPQNLLSSFLFRASIPAGLLFLAIFITSSRHPSPWLSTGLPIFLHPPPSVSFTSVQPPQDCQDLSLTTIEPREAGAIVLLLRESDLDELRPTLINFEEMFNANFRYPYVFLSSPDEPPFSETFKDQIANVLPEGALVEYAMVPLEHWSLPTWLDKASARMGFAQQEKDGVQYAGREAYHHMCRFYSGFFARQQVLKKYDWYWRLEPGVRFYCKITYDPFRFLSLHKKVYGFVIAITETPNTIPNLFNTVKEYVLEEGIKVGEGMWDFLTKEAKGINEAEYNMCHFWTNFEIGDLRFFRSQEYQNFFTMLDRKGGFYSERWGDAPIRALALALFADVDQVHYFEDFAYKHDYFMHCPNKKGLGCDCKCPAYKKGVAEDIDQDWSYSCIPNWRNAVEKYGHFPSTSSLSS